jgi:sphinganine-1-phosphate aldolase
MQGRGGQGSWWRGQSVVQWAEHAVVAGVAVYGTAYVLRRGVRGVAEDVTDLLVSGVPGAASALDARLEQEVEDTLASLFGDRAAAGAGGEDALATSVRTLQRRIPSVGRDRGEVLAQMRRLRSERDVDPKKGTVFALIYTNPDGAHYRFIDEVFALFMNENALNPIAFPSLRKFENEVVRMSCALLGGDDQRSCGNLTSGGTESLLLAVKTWRDYVCAKKAIRKPEMVLPETAHPAFRKAAHYFGVRTVIVPTRSADLAVDVDAVRAAVTRNTVLIVASAPTYPHGVVDDIAAIGRIGLDSDVPLHVDACMGGFILPWARRLGYPVPQFDLSVPGVCSISADLHKYGFTPKGASVLLYAQQEYRRAQFFAEPVWSGGMYISPTMLGTRGGGSIAAAWATMVTLGEAGYTELARICLETADFFRAEVAKIPPLRIMGNSVGSLLAIGSSDPADVHILVVADVMEERFGWTLDRQNGPDCIHLTVMPPNSDTRQRFVDDLRASVAEIRTNRDRWGGKGSKAAMYGMVASIPSGSVIERFLVSLMDGIYK